MTRFLPTRATSKLAPLISNNRVSVVQGGQGAGKTVSILMFLVSHAEYEQDREISILGGELSKMKRGVMRDFIKILKDWGIFEDSRWNRTDKIYSFRSGSFIEFIGMDSDDIGKSMRRDVVYFNEVNRGVTFEGYQGVSSRSAKVVVDYNPDASFWIHEEVVGQPGVGFIILTFLDNEFLPSSERDSILDYKRRAFHDPDITDKKQLYTGSNIKSEYWLNKWKVYGLGETGALEGVVYEQYVDWVICDSMPPSYDWIVTGMDFGYTNDPTAIYDISYSGGELWIDEIAYETGLSNPGISEVLKGHDRTREIRADPSDPKSIDELKGLRWNVKRAEGGPDSIKHGIEVLKRQKMNVTKRSKGALKEFEKYKWATDKDGNKLNKPIDAWNHAMDAIRYGVASKLGTKSRSNYGSYSE